jgi:prolyl oligopeptidase
MLAETYGAPRMELMRTLLLMAPMVLLVLSVYAEPLKYPPTKKVELVERLHDTFVPDPYRWLEEDVRKSKEVADWVAAQAKFTEDFLAAIPQRKAIRQRLEEVVNVERYSAPSKHGGRYYFQKNNGLQNQAVLYRADKTDGPADVVIDPNTWSKEGTIALGGLDFSDDGKFLAYGVAEAGSDWNTFKILDLTSLKPLDDEVKWIKYTGVAWDKAGKGFYYGRFPEPEKGQELQATNRDHKVYYHKIGSKQSDDLLVYERKDQPDWLLMPGTSEDGRYLVISAVVGTENKNRVFLRDLSKADSKITPLIDVFEADYTFLGNVGTTLYFKTDREAPRSRIIAIDADKPEPRDWKEIVPQAEEPIEAASLVGGKLICQYLKDVKPLVKVFSMDGKWVRNVEAPGIGTMGGFGGRQDDPETFYSFTSFATPATIYSYNVNSGETKLFRKPATKFNPDDYTVEQVFYPSKDGTKIPMFLAYKKGLKKDGANPTRLYGYGGFQIALTPAYSVVNLVWMEMGGIYAVANLRGGGEYGKVWHDAGRLKHKQNVFDDFIAAAEYLIANKYTRPDRLAIQGGSNGGLLVGACETQRPDLFGAALPAVGVMDMLRFHKWTAGRFWVDDYGNPDKADDFLVLLAYSPYHNIKSGTKYPATLVMTADTDDRVVPRHSFKYLAALQAAQAGDAPILGRIDIKAGHGAGKPLSKTLDEYADILAFLVKVLKMDPGKP